jgi:hypothetical protein
LPQALSFLFEGIRSAKGSLEALALGILQTLHKPLLDIDGSTHQVVFDQLVLFAAANITNHQVQVICTLGHHFLNA